MKTFLEELALQLYKDDKLSSESLFILPSIRAVNYLKNCFVTVVQKPIFSPTIVSIEEFIQNISRLNPASNPALKFLLFESYCTSKIESKDEFPAFLNWAPTLLHDFNEIDRHLVDPPSLFTYLSEAKKLNEWRLQDANKSNLASNYLKFWKQLHHIYIDFQQKLLKGNMGHQGLMYRKAYDNLSEYLKTAEHNRFFFIGFNALNTSENKIIQYLLENTDSEIYWDIDTYFLEDHLHAASSFIRSYLKEWKYLQKQGIKGTSTNYCATKNIELIGVPKNVSQSKYVGNILRKVYDPRERTALVLSDESLLESILHAIPPEIGAYNITMGRPLTQTVFHTFLHTLFSVHGNASERGFFYQDVIAFLSNPYTSLLLKEVEDDFAQKITSYIKRHNLIYVTSETLVEFESAPKSILKKIFSKERHVKDYLIHFNDLVESISRKLKSQKNNSEYAISKKFKGIFEQLIQYVDTHSFIQDVTVLKRLYLDLISLEKLDFKGDPNKGLQIMGMLESRNLDFDTLIITSVNEGILPSSRSTESFIPYDIKRAFSIPTYREKDAIYAYHFYRLLQRAKNSYILYNTEPDVLEGGEKSRFINQMIVDGNINKNITQSIASPSSKVSRKVPSVITKVPSLLTEIGNLAREGFSPTSLSDYIRNPIDFYKRHILHLKDTMIVEELMALNTFGTLVHDTLEIVYQPFVGTILTPEGLLERKAHLAKHLTQCFSKNLPKANFKIGRNLIIYNVILKYLENFIDSEVEESKNHTIKIISLEQKLSCELQIAQIDHPVILKGKLDRVDEKDGQLRIIDYKTGKVQSSEVEIMDWDKLITEPKYAKAFQLLCYAKMHHQEFKNEKLEAGIVPIKKIGASLARFATKSSIRGAKDHSITREVLQTFEALLEKLILEIFDPNIPFIEKEV